ncbi:hypothetical protein CORC01_10508 [Colletotrichum orchidophilum]|uniref:Uncharacterized protein n=1 Tax=Colletotrichum orchidophilum TaxID=1209926 RepID=A0A1G4AYC6_9PEZI|nr:uncharacterized protein CORC01_10508 [Colletotrichum orchidophilum]OHE94170.1 hypothetical protein CORC01_10508 [Colletotrichum orchidophilum]
MNTTSTAKELEAQWINPGDVSTILFILGGDIVQKAFSQGTGKAYVPVCFSFGCAAYAFIGLVGIIGDGRLLSPPDYACKVLNLGSGYLRESRSFVLGRLLRDMEAVESRMSVADDEDGDYALRISVFEATWNGNDPTKFSWSYLHLIGMVVTLIQLGIALVPFFINRSWNVLLITAAGTVLVQLTGILPQWTAEKLPNRQRSAQIFALTTGNGSRDIMVILGYGRCLDLEALASMPSPRISRPWEKFRWLSKPQRNKMKEPMMPRRNTMLRNAKRCAVWPVRGLPLGFILTQTSFIILSVLWLLLLINVSGSRSIPETWCILGVGGLGMFQNAWLAAAEVPTKLRNLPLKRVDRIKSRKVMDAIMDFHTTYGRGTSLRNEFFPGELKPEEKSWWHGDYSQYEKKRREDKLRSESRRDSPNKYPRFLYDGTELEYLHQAEPFVLTDDFDSGRQYPKASPEVDVAGSKQSTKGSDSNEPTERRQWDIERGPETSHNANEKVTNTDGGIDVDNKKRMVDGAGLMRLSPTTRHSLIMRPRTDSMKSIPWAT